MRKRAQIRASMKARYWHIGWCVFGATSIFGIANFAYIRNVGKLPGLKDIWWLVVLVPLVCGVGVTLGCGGAALWKRFIAAAACGSVVGVLYMAVSAILTHSGGIAAGNLVADCLWRIFVFAAFSTVVFPRLIKFM